MTCNCAARLDALEARLTDLEADHGPRITSLELVTRRLERKVDQLTTDVGRIADASTTTSLTVERLEREAQRQGDVLSRVHSLLEQLVRQRTPSVEVSGV